MRSFCVKILTAYVRVYGKRQRSRAGGHPVHDVRVYVRVLCWVVSSPARLFNTYLRRLSVGPRLICSGARCCDIQIKLWKKIKTKMNKNPFPREGLKRFLFLTIRRPLVAQSLGVRDSFYSAAARAHNNDTCVYRARGYWYTCRFPDGSTRNARASDRDQHDGPRHSSLSKKKKKMPRSFLPHSKLALRMCAKTPASVCIGLLPVDENHRPSTTAIHTY